MVEIPRPQIELGKLDTNCHKCEEPMNYNDRFFMYDCQRCQIIISSKLIKRIIPKT